MGIAFAVERAVSIETLQIVKRDADVGFFAEC
jgi:hypothetical protein